MQSSYFVKVVAAVVVLALVGVGWQTRDTWGTWLNPGPDNTGDHKKVQAADHAERVKLSPQAQKNLRLVVKEIQPTTYWKKIYLPGTVVDRPGHSDRGIPAPIAGVVTWVNAIPGKTVKVGEELFRLRLVSESFQSSQMELFKSTREREIVQKERKRLEGISSVAVPAAKLLELQYQEDRLGVAIQAYRQDLHVRQLTPTQINDITKGEFVTEVVIRLPERLGQQKAPGQASSSRPSEYEVQELKVNLGDHVQAGQILAYIADHAQLYVEGRALKQEAKLLAQAAMEGWNVEAEFSEDDEHSAGERLTNLRVQFLGNTMDASGLTLPVYVLFSNPMREFKIEKRTYRTGQYRPGQKVLLKVDVEKKDDVFVVPRVAVVREGPEAYVFRQNGSSFDRRAVHVVAEDTDVVVIEHDGSIIPGDAVAHNGAAALNRVLKAGQAEGGGGGHGHQH